MKLGISNIISMIVVILGFASKLVLPAYHLLLSTICLLLPSASLENVPTHIYKISALIMSDYSCSHISYSKGYSRSPVQIARYDFCISLSQFWFPQIVVKTWSIFTADSIFGEKRFCGPSRSCGPCWSVVSDKQFN